MSSDSIPSALRFAAAVAAIALVPTARSNDQNIYLVSKSQLFFQTASSGSVADPITAAAFGVEASSNVTLTLPGGGTTAVTQSGGSSSAKLDQTFATKAALDAAFPNGTYKLTGPSIPALTFNLGTETYPTATPSVINGTWTNGVLVVNPAASTTINFSTDSTYASAGVAGHMSLEIDSTTNNENVDLQQQIATQGVFGLTQASAPFTSYTIPANTLIDGHVYQVELDFNALSTLDTTSLPDGGAVAIWQKGLHFYIVASSAGKLTAPTVPVLANVGTTAGGKVTLGLPTFDSTNAHTDWFFNGQQLNFDGTSTKYSFENYPSLTINNVVAADAGTYQARIVTPGGLVTSNVATLTINASNVSPFTTQPSNQSAASGGTVSLSAIASGNPAYQWQFDGLDLSGETGFTLALSSFTAAASGLYTVSVNSGAAISAAAIVGMLTDAAVTGDGNVVQTSIAHPNGKLYDQVVLTGAAAAIHTQGGRTTRTSFIDENNDIVQVEFTGAGTLSLVLDDPSGPANPVNYTQSFAYMKGHVGLVIAGADETSNVLIFTVGRATAFDPTGHYDILKAPATPGSGAANDPATNGSPLFGGHDATHYDGFADLAFVAITSTNGKFGGLRASNAHFSAVNGFTGVYAPGVAFAGPVYIGDIDAGSTSAAVSATPVIIIGSTADARITGGDLRQTNGKAVQVHGLTQLKFTAGSDAAGALFPARNNQGVLEDNGVNVTSQVVMNP